MKQRLLDLGNKVDALSLRERVMVFAAVAGSIIFLCHSALLDPLYAKQKSLRAQIRQEQNNAIGIDAGITQLAQAHALDPDAADRVRLQAIGAEAAQLGTALRTMQRGLVAPEKMMGLLEDLLKGHGRLRLLSLKTLPVSGLGEGAFKLPKEVLPAVKQSAEAEIQNNINHAIAGADARTAAAPVKPPELLYRHGVEIVLQGSYPDMVSYMAALEAMPTQLFWAKAKLDAQAYPRSRLTLVVYTLSLDNKWIAL